MDNDITWSVLCWKTFLDEQLDIGHVFVLLTGHVLWVRQVIFPW